MSRGGKPKSLRWTRNISEKFFPIDNIFYDTNSLNVPEESSLVNDITRKQVAADIFTSHDYSLLAVSGSDRIGMDRKVDIWRTEVEDKIDLLQSWEVF